MKGFVFDPVARKMDINAGGGRVTLSIPDSFPVLLLPTEHSQTVNAAFPDVPKGRYFYHYWSAQYAVGNWFTTEQGYSLVTATPQEWSQVTVLADAPPDTDIFPALVRVNRTVSPSHNWLNESIAVLVPQNVWIPLTGSLLLEAATCFARALSIYIETNPLDTNYGKLVLHQQQSVGVSPGGYGTLPGGEPSALSSIPPPGQNFQQGGEVLGSGYPVYQGPNVAPQYKATSGPGDVFAFSVAVRQTHRQSGSNPPSISDPTNYGATWQIEIRGQFGRRS